MSPPAEWTLPEFAVLMASAELTAEELSQSDLPGRTPGAIEVMRQAVHLQHRGEPSNDILSQMMISFLARRPDLARSACALCRHVSE